MDKIELQWATVKEKNPHLLYHCYRLCLRAKERGITQWSADAMFHVLRWETAVTTGDHDLKINNNYSSLIARDLMAEYPELEGFFSLRTRKAKNIEDQIT